MAKPCAAAYIPAGVHGDAHKIRLFAAFIAKCDHGLVHLEKGFLNRVLGQLLIPKHRVTHTAQVRLVLFDQSGQRLIPEIVRTRDNLHAPITFLWLPDLPRGWPIVPRGISTPLTCLDGAKKRFVRFFITGRGNACCRLCDQAALCLHVHIGSMIPVRIISFFQCCVLRYFLSAIFQAACLQLLQAFTTKQNGFRLRLSNEREAETILPMISVCVHI